MILYDNDAYRDDFMEMVYSLLHSDGTNDRANLIIDAFDRAPKVEAEPFPPNDPLTLEELREMDGEPVWAVNNRREVVCALTYSPCSIVYLTFGDGTHWDAEDLLDEGCKIYRRKPEEKNNGSDSSC